MSKPFKWRGPKFMDRGIFISWHGNSKLLPSSSHFYGPSEDYGCRMVIWRIVTHSPTIRHTSYSTVFAE